MWATPSIDDLRQTWQIVASACRPPKEKGRRLNVAAAAQTRLMARSSTADHFAYHRQPARRSAKTTGSGTSPVPRRCVSRADPGSRRRRLTCSVRHRLDSEETPPVSRGAGFRLRAHRGQHPSKRLLARYRGAPLASVHCFFQPWPVATGRPNQRTDTSPHSSPHRSVELNIMSWPICDP